MKVKIIEHHFYDPEFEGEDQTLGDYAEISIEVDGIETIRYGDWYHDKGKEKAEGYIDGLRYSNSNVFVERTKIADLKE
jgi:hypothetical protein